MKLTIKISLIAVAMMAAMSACKSRVAPVATIVPATAGTVADVLPMIPVPDSLSVTIPGRDVEFAPHTLIVMCEQKDSLRAEVQRYGAKVIYDYKYINGMAISVPANVDINEAKRHFEAVPGVLSVERDRINHLH